MDEQREQAGSTLDQYGSAMGWWSFSTNRIIEDRLHRFQQLATGLHRAYSQACDGQFDALSVANKYVTRSVEELLSIRRPDELLSAETEAISGLMKATSVQMKTWTDFTQNIQSCYMDVARDTTSDIGHEAHEAASKVEQQVEQTVRSTKQRVRRAVTEADNQARVADS